MKAALKSEIRKLLSVRSTYIITGLALLILGFVSFWVGGYKFSGPVTSHFSSGNIFDVAPALSVFTVIAAILLMGHEYRYNLIVYTLTASNSRSKVLLAKIITTILYTTAMVLVVVSLTIALQILGLHLAGHSLPHQEINISDIFLRLFVYCVGFSLAGLLFATLIRNLIFAIVFMFIVPNTVEALLTLLLKEKAIYLPFSALSQVIGTANNNGPLKTGHLSPLKGGVVFGIYLLVGWAVTWYLFVRRDVA
jgi:ABC-type transport system involved in multi-copper enzyme maturation permease subunit